MTENNETGVVNKRMDRLNQFLLNELNGITNLASQIPDKARIYHGAYNDPELMKADTKMATHALITMLLGLETEVPLRMIYEYAPAKFTVIDMASEERKRQVRKLLISCHEQSIQTVQTEMSQLVAV
ncbi:hypothetical protein QUF63_16175 [Anaerolineales bacterium HSG25]|nr:hypothetical protein [Anaerolineales bacterium HSG25]